MKYPIANHPLFEEKWDKHARTFNRLSDILRDYGLGTRLLIDAIESAMEVEELASDTAFEMGVKHGLALTMQEGAKNELSCTCEVGNLR